MAWQEPLLQSGAKSAAAAGSRPFWSICKLSALRAVVLAAVVVFGVQLARLHEQGLEVLTHPGALGTPQLNSQPRAQPVQLRYPVWWHAPFYTGSGYSTEAISYVSSLLRTDSFRPEDVWISHSGDHILQHVDDSFDTATRQLLHDQEYNRLAKGSLAKKELERPAIAVCHSFPDCWLMPHDVPTMQVPGCPCPPPSMNELIAYRIGRTMFETAGLPQHLVQHCNAMDEVWVPTDFNKETFIAAGVAADKLRVVPQGIDAADFDPSKHRPLCLRELFNATLLTGTIPHYPLEAEPFVFLSVFKWEARKGWDVLLDAYLHEFRGDEPVELHIMTKPFAKSEQDIGQQVLAWLEKRLGFKPHQVATLPKVYLHTGYLDDATYRRLYASSDCVVLPTRGEGWGRPQMEAMSMGKPVITTNWSGPTAYINDRVAYPLAYDSITAASIDMQATSLDAKGVNDYFTGQHWAQPSVSHLRQLMRHVVSNPGEAAAKGRSAREHILAHFTPDVLASVVMGEIMRIQDHLGPNRTVPTAEERAAKQQTQALCHTYPHLCRQGPAGLAEANKRAQSSFSHYRARAGPRVIMPGHLTVHELLAMTREASKAARLNLGTH